MNTDLDAELEALMKELDATGGDDAGTKQEPAADPQPATEPGMVEDVIAELQSLRKEITARAAQADAKKAPEDGDDPSVDIPIPQVTNEELGNIAAYRAQLEKLAQSAVGEQLKAVTAELAETKKLLKKLKQEQAQSTEASFATALRAAIPDIDSLTTDPKFAEYVKQPAPLSGGRTIADLLNDAYKAHNIAQVREIIDGYKAKQNDGAKQAQQVQQLPTADARPAMSTAPGAPEKSTGGAATVFDKINEARTAALQLYLNGKMSYERYLDTVAKLDAKEASLGQSTLQGAA